MTVSLQAVEPAAILLQRLHAEVLPQIAAACGWGEPFRDAHLVTRKARGTVFRCIHPRGTLAVKLEGTAPRASQTTRDEFDAMHELQAVDPTGSRLGAVRPVAHVAKPAAVASEWVHAPTLATLVRDGWTQRTARAVGMALDWIGAHQELPHGARILGHNPGAPCDDVATRLDAVVSGKARDVVRAAAARHATLNEGLDLARLPLVRRHGDASAGNFLILPDRVLAIDLSRELVGSAAMDAVQLAIDVALHLPQDATPTNAATGLPEPLAALLIHRGFVVDGGAARAVFDRELLRLSLLRAAELAAAGPKTPYGPRDAALSRALTILSGPAGLLA